MDRSKCNIVELNSFFRASLFWLPLIYTWREVDAILLNCIRHTASEITGNKIRYRMNGAGNARGSGMTNTILNGAGNYQTRFVNANDYRSQEFPNGTAVTAATHYLRI